VLGSMIMGCGAEEREFEYRGVVQRNPIKGKPVIQQWRFCEKFKYERMENMKKVSLVSCVVLLIIGLFTQGCARKKEAEAIVDNAQKEAEAIVDNAKKEAEAIVDNAKKEAEAILNNAKKEAEGYILHVKNELYKLYPNLKEYKPGSNVVNDKYIKLFSVRGNKIKIEMHNATRDTVKPNANINFLNREGFITENYTLLWIFSRIKPGETRFDEGSVEFKYGEPVYYRIDFDDSGSSGSLSGSAKSSNGPSPARAPAPRIPGDVTYSIIGSDTFLDYKHSLDIRLNKKVSEETLRAIALKLKAQDSRNYERTFICYYLPDMKVDSGAWATTHFNPNLEVRILGLTVEQEKSLKQKPDVPSREVIGIWFSDLTSSKFTIYRQNGKVYMEEMFKDGSSSKNEMVKKVSSGRQRFEEKGGSSIGEYFLIDGQGNLQIFGMEGLVATAIHIK
jgi:hypothetical protein